MSILVGVVLLGPLKIPDERIFNLIIALVDAVVGVRGLVGDIDQVGEAEVVHLPFRVPIAAVVPLPVKTVFRAPHVKILRHHSRIHIDGGVFVIAGYIKGPVIHDVVKIDADPEAVGHFHHVEEFRFGAVPGADGVALVLRAEIKWIP